MFRSSGKVNAHLILVDLSFLIVSTNSSGLGDDAISARALEKHFHSLETMIRCFRRDLFSK